MERGSFLSTEISPCDNEDYKARPPYQAYCVTVASSRPQSPDTVSLDYSQSPSQSTQDLCDGAHIDPGWIVALDLLPDRAAASYPERDHCIAKTDSIRELQHQRTNSTVGSGKSQWQNLNHIAQTVSPRGSHSLASNDTIVYDGTRSQWQTRHLDVSNKQTPRTILLEPIDSFELEEMARDSQQSTSPLINVQAESKTTLRCETPDSSFSTGDTDLSARSKGLILAKLDEDSDEHLVKIESLASLDLEAGLSLLDPCGLSKHVELCQKSVADETAIVDPTLRPTQTNIVREDSFHHNFQGSTCDEQVQLPSTGELYLSRGLRSITSREGWAHRRTIPREAQLRYSFGHRPRERLLGSHTKSPPRREVDAPPTKYFQAPSSKSFCSSVVVQAGPRAPPWGSYDKLESQRRQRGNTREQSRVMLELSDMDSSSMLLEKSQSSQNPGQGLMRREVEDYRHAVLAVYPDMTFEEDVRYGESECCCCIVM